MNEVARFLSSHAPFRGLRVDVVDAVAESVQVAYFPTGSTILQQLGSPAEFVYVVRTGSVELLHDGQVIDVLEEGEIFGHPSLLSGHGPAYTVRVREDALCYLIPGEVADAVFGSPSGLGFLAGSLRRRMDLAEQAHEGSKGDPRLLRAGALVARAPLECDPETPVREAALRMTREGVSAVLVRVDGGLGIVTDTDVRARVVAEGLSLETPLREVMSFPARAVGPDRLVHEVLLDMLEAGMHHLPVVDGSGRVLGVVSDMDILGLERRDPFDLRAEVDRAATPEEVARVGARIPGSVATLARSGLEPEDVGHVVAVLVDAMTSRLLELAQDDLGDPPAPWAWLALGSEGRREQALATDQDHGLVYADDARPHDAYFEGLAARVVDGLEACGIRRCPSGVLASEPAWRDSLPGWVEAFEHGMAAPSDKPAFVTSIGFDYRQIAGPLAAEATLDAVVRSAKDRPAFIWRLARLAVEMKPPLGFRGDVVVRTVGDHRGVLDIKEGGLIPVTDLARLFALEAGLATSSTVERLRGAAAAGTIDGETCDALEEAFHVFLETRLDHQVRQVESAEPPDNLVDPRRLGRIERNRLKDAFRIVAHVQRDLGRRLSGTSRLR